MNIVQLTFPFKLFLLSSFPPSLTYSPNTHSLTHSLTHSVMQARAPCQTCRHRNQHRPGDGCALLHHSQRPSVQQPHGPDRGSTAKAGHSEPLVWDCPGKVSAKGNHYHKPLIMKPKLFTCVQRAWGMWGVWLRGWVRYW